MIDKIILNIRHSDSFTDYLFMTAGLTNKRIIPLLNPEPAEIRRQSDSNTLVLRCHSSRKKCDENESPVMDEVQPEGICVCSSYYLDDDGAIDAEKAAVVRASIETSLLHKLYDPANLLEVYRLYFPQLWKARQKIYADPELFYVKSGRYSCCYDGFIHLGSLLKAIEEDPHNFRISLGGGCSCREKPILVDYPSRFSCDNFWWIFTWCPVCGARRRIETSNFWRVGACDNSLEQSRRFYDKGQGYSNLSLLDVVDSL